MDIFQREKLLIGEEKFNYIKDKKIIVFGCGGVGSYVIEALARAGIENIDIVDKDVIDVTNINRQIIATLNTIGKNKVDVERERILSINPNAKVNTFKINFTKENSNLIDFNSYDYVVDAVDDVNAKIEIIVKAKEANTNVISSMGTGNKLNPFEFKICDISKTSVCPLAKIIRKELKKLDIRNVKVLYSNEEPLPVKRVDEKIVQGSISFVPSVAGLMISSEVINDLLNSF